MNKPYKMETSETETRASTTTNMETVNPYPETSDGPKENSGDETSSKGEIFRIFPKISYAK